MGNGKESYTETVARIDERLRGFTELNTEQHKEIIKKIEGNRKEIDILCTHVNDENCKMNNRVTKLENKQIEADSRYKTRLQIYKSLSAILAVTLSILGILKGLGII